MVGGSLAQRPDGAARSAWTRVIETIERATGRWPRGWMGPGLTEIFRTPALLAELGLSYVLDWTNDDQPYPLNVPGMLSVPYSVELNDLGLFISKGLSGPDFLRLVKTSSISSTPTRRTAAGSWPSP